jgi:hypothetical protein
VRIDGSTSGIAAVATANTIYLSPFIPANTLTVLNLQINVTVPAVGGLARILVYSDLNGVPSSKLLESILNLDCSTTGAKTSTPPTPFTFTAGTTYWLGLYSSAAVTLSTISNNNLIPLSSSAFNSSICVLTATATFPTAPSTLGTASGLPGNSMYVINLTSI